MPTLLESLPSRPLKRSEVDNLDGADPIDGVFPIYGERPSTRDTAFGLAIAKNGTLYGIGFSEGWEVVATESVQEMHSEQPHQNGGIHFDDHEALEDIQSEITEQIDTASR